MFWNFAVRNNINLYVPSQKIILQLKQKSTEKVFDVQKNSKQILEIPFFSLFYLCTDNLNSLQIRTKKKRKQITCIAKTISKKVYDTFQIKKLPYKVEGIEELTSRVVYGEKAKGIKFAVRLLQDSVSNLPFYYICKVMQW